MTTPAPTAPARPVEEALAYLTPHPATKGPVILDPEKMRAAVQAIAAETAALREESERLREIVESDHDGKAIAEYEWERANKLAADNAALRQRVKALEHLNGLLRESHGSVAAAEAQSTADQAEIARMRAELDRRGNRTCPFPDANLEPHEPCPVCGDLGTFDAENMNRPSNCVARPLPGSAPARAALTKTGDDDA